MALSVRTRFEVFKRDEFTCKYCGRRSPEVILEVDHIVPQCDGGSDDPINLTTSCWDCNHGKAGVPLATVMTGEDPHDRAIELLERERQLREYNVVLQEERDRREADAWQLWKYWLTERGIEEKKRLETMPRRDLSWLMNTLAYCPRVTIMEFMDAAMAAGATRDLRYVGGCVKNWREQPTQAQRQPSVEGQRVEEAIADLQRILGITREEAIASLRESDEEIRAYDRAKLIEEVLLRIREADYYRRNRGRCHHQPECTTVLECVQADVRTVMGLPPSNGAPSL